MKLEIEKPLLKSLTVMASLIEARDAYTGGHLWRVSQYSGRLAETAALPAEMIFLSRLGGFLHDIGKIAVPDGILEKRGRLSEQEYAVVKTHPGIGATLIQEHPYGDLALAAVHQHHERIDGRGYPEKIKGDQISIFARIVSIADAFDALTSTRPYRKGGQANSAVETLKAEQGTQFDAQLLDTFIQMVRLDSIRDIVGHSEQGVAMVECPSCGPVITVTRLDKDGDIGFCRVCGAKHRLHRKGDTFEVEPSGEMGTAEELKPHPEIHSIETFISSAPLQVQI